jgi:hypothetical protein
MEKYDIDPSQVTRAHAGGSAPRRGRPLIQGPQIGRLEVGTESRSDKSKSVKTELLRLFGPHTEDLEGAPGRHRRAAQRAHARTWQAWTTRTRATAAPLRC